MKVHICLIEMRKRHKRGVQTQLLGCCTSGDAALWLKRLPAQVAFDLGHCLIPGLGALTLEGVPEADVSTFIASIKPRVRKLLADCDAAQATTAGSIEAAYTALKEGRSIVPRICAEAVSLADQAAAFCKRYGV